MADMTDHSFCSNGIGNTLMPPYASIYKQLTIDIKVQCDISALDSGGI
jgi:hypothetical protein